MFSQLSDLLLHISIISISMYIYNIKTRLLCVCSCVCLHVCLFVCLFVRIVLK